MPTIYCTECDSGNTKLITGRTNIGYSYYQVRQCEDCSARFKYFPSNRKCEFMYYNDNNKQAIVEEKENWADVRFDIEEGFSVQQSFRNWLKSAIKLKQLKNNTEKD